MTAFDPIAVIREGCHFLEMREASTLLLLCAFVAGCAAHSPSSPFAEGKLVQRAYVELIGDEQEVETIKSEAPRLGWAVDCEGQLGDYSTLRLGFPAGTTKASIDARFGSEAFFARQKWQKLQFIYDEMPRTKGACASW
jgi:hypothetical protein